MKMVAFLQNMWAKNPAKVKASLDKYPADIRHTLRRRYIEYALFAGCLTGRRLRAALGEELCERIVWEEANPIIADNPKDYHPPDPAHIRNVLELERPGLVLCLTRAGEGVIRSLCECNVIACPHPASRQADIIAKLANVKTQIELLCL